MTNVCVGLRVENRGRGAEISYMDVVSCFLLLLLLGVARSAQRISRSNVITDHGQHLLLVTDLVRPHASCLYLQRGVDVDVLGYLKYSLCVAHLL